MNNPFSPQHNTTSVEPQVQQFQTPVVGTVPVEPQVQQFQTPAVGTVPVEPQVQPVTPPVEPQVQPVVPPVEPQVQPVVPPVEPQVQPVPQNNFNQPTTVNATLPVLEPGQSIICQLQPGLFDAFIKVLSFLDDKNIINISNSQICQSINNGTAILMTDISKLVGGKSINLHILSPKKYISLFKAIKGNNDVFIIDDPVRSQFIVRSGSTKLWLPKQIEQLQIDSAPILDGITAVGNTIKISKEERSKIMALMKDQQYIVQLLQQNQLKGYMIPETLEDSFLQFSGYEINESNADVKLMSYSFLTIPSDGDSDVNIGYLNGQYWMNTLIRTAIVEIIVFEALSPMQDDKLLI